MTVFNSVSDQALTTTSTPTFAGLRVGTPVNGSLLIGNTTGNTFDVNTLTAGAGVAISNGNGEITISAFTGGYNFVDVDESGTITIAPQTIYFLNNSGTTIFELSTDIPEGSAFGIQSSPGSTGNFEIHQTAASQSFLWGVSATTTGATGKVISIDDFNSLFFNCVISTVDDQVFQVISNVGINYSLE